MFCDREGNPGDICFLEGIITDHFAIDLAGYADDRGRIHISRGNSGDQIGCSGT